MGVDVRGGAVGCPAGVAYTHRASHWLFSQEHFELGQFALTTSHLDFAFADQGYTGTVIATIFQSPQAVHQQRHAVILAYVSYYPAHFIPLPISTILN
jgi:hypothetical protein